MTTAEQAPPPEVEPGEIVGGKWRIAGLIGRGGMGAVYEGQNIGIGKKVALKFIDAEFARQPEVASRFQREAEAASLVESAHIVHVFDSGTTDNGTPYIVMELLRGEDLRARLKRMGRLPVAEAVHVVAQILRGLHRAHEAGIVHRDLKPDNVFLVDRDDDPLFAKIVDFGISKVTRRPGEVGVGTLTRQGVVLGTPFYMSPEQAQALPGLDHRTDLWSVGAILYECLAGRPPHLGDTYEQIIISICTADATPLRTIAPEVPQPLADLVAKALERDTTKRFASAKGMLEGLQMAGFGVRSLPTGPSAAAGAASAPSPSGPSPSAPDGPGATRTRVTFTSGSAALASPMADTLLEADAHRTDRARGVRRTGLVAVGGAVTLAAFLLTFGLLRGQRGSEGDEARPRPAAPSGATPSGGSAGVPPLPVVTPVPIEPDPAASGGVPPAPSSASTSAPADPLARTAPPAPASRAAKSKKGGSATPPAQQPTSTPPPVAPPAAPTASSGVAGGLRIKTSYP